MRDTLDRDIPMSVKMGPKSFKEIKDLDEGKQIDEAGLSRNVQYMIITTTVTEWSPFLVNSKYLSNIEPIFERIDTTRIEEEFERLIKQSEYDYYFRRVLKN